MKRNFNYIYSLLGRYLILILVGIIGVGIFYIIFTPLTIYPVYFLLNSFFDVTLSSNILLINGLPIEIIGPCIAGSAYYLLLILNLSTPKIKSSKRIFSLLFSFGLLLLINVLRIFFLSILWISGSSFFDITHRLFWIFGSVVFVVGIWFLTVVTFKIKEVPFYSDITSLIESLNKGKKTKSHKQH